MHKALDAPARQNASNAGEDGSIIVGKVVDNASYTWGYDAQTGTYGDLVAGGIIDPTVVHTAPQDAASIAGLLIALRRWWRRSPRRAAPPAPPPMDY